MFYIYQLKYVVCLIYCFNMSVAPQKVENMACLRVTSCSCIICYTMLSFQTLRTGKMLPSQLDTIKADANFVIARSTLNWKSIKGFCSCCCNSSSSSSMNDEVPVGIVAIILGTNNSEASSWMRILTLWLVQMCILSELNEGQLNNHNFWWTEEISWGIPFKKRPCLALAHWCIISTACSVLTSMMLSELH